MTQNPAEMRQSKIRAENTEAEIIAVSDGMNIPLWLADFLHYQDSKIYPVRLEQGNQSYIERKINCRDHPVHRDTKILDFGLYPQRCR